LCGAAQGGGCGHLCLRRRQLHFGH
jgi:hypothetical protein